uniref:surfactant-associated protein 3 n=1 Tax=Macaca mulatta TaxID=9544 RepID=UPI0005F3ABED|nr:surfactant-associated protein 3 isoform X2 [Macaca nemestrina]XP_014999074.1 surfactant-associated protein 3 [Macaca mulatta]
MRARFSDFQLIRDQVLFIQDQAQRLTEWLQLSGFENPVSESTTLCPREREKWIPTCVAICVPSPGTVHAALRHPTTLSQRSSPEAEVLSSECSLNKQSC